MFRSLAFSIFLVASGCCALLFCNSDALVVAVNYEIKGYVKGSSLRANLQETEQFLAKDVRETEPHRMLFFFRYPKMDST